jgi:hypothetical protein
MQKLNGLSSNLAPKLSPGAPPSPGVLAKVRSAA